MELGQAVAALHILHAQLDVAVGIGLVLRIGRLGTRAVMGEQEVTARMSGKDACGWTWTSPVPHAVIAEPLAALVCLLQRAPLCCPVLRKSAAAGWPPRLPVQQSSRSQATAPVLRANEAGQIWLKLPFRGHAALSRCS